MEKRNRVLILKNSIPDDHLPWVQACKNNNVDFGIVDLTKNTWLDDITKEQFDYLVAKPDGLSNSFKKLYDERIYILSEELKLPVFPSLKEILIYENKRFLSFWLKANKIPHPNTYIFYSSDECKNFISNYKGIIVAKSNIGASGSGVKLLKTKDEKDDYVYNAFLGKGVPRRVGPNFEKGGILKRGLKYLLNPDRIKKRLEIYKHTAEVQKGFVIFQDFIPHDFEWRVVRIGESFFAHKKLKYGEKTSGTLLKGYESPPLKLLDFVKHITDKHKFYSQAVDLFEQNGNYFVNEMQCIFGQSDTFQMKVNDKIGRYLYLNNKWVFEEGDFAKNACYDLRVEFIINNLVKD